MLYTYVVQLYVILNFTPYFIHNLCHGSKLYCSSSVISGSFWSSFFAVDGTTKTGTPSSSIRSIVTLLAYPKIAVRIALTSVMTI